MKPKIVGKKWEIWLDEDCYLWDFAGDGLEISKMLAEEFPSSLIYESYRDRYAAAWGTRFGPLYEDSLAFLRKWGVKCEGVDLPELNGEAGPAD